MQLSLECSILDQATLTTLRFLFSARVKPQRKDQGHSKSDDMFQKNAAVPYYAKARQDPILITLLGQSRNCSPFKNSATINWKKKAIRTKWIFQQCRPVRPLASTYRITVIPLLFHCSVECVASLLLGKHIAISPSEAR